MDKHETPGTVTLAQQSTMDVFDRAPDDVRLALADEIESYEDDLISWSSTRFAKPVSIGQNETRVTCCPIGLLVYQWIRLHGDDVGITLDQWMHEYACASSYRYGMLIGNDDLSSDIYGVPTQEQNRASSDARTFINAWDNHDIAHADLVAYLRASRD